MTIRDNLMNLASIDIGSNTVLLLIGKIVNNSVIPIINKYESPRLGKGLKPGGEILKDRIDHLLTVLSNYKSIIEEYDCKEIIIAATNAMRIASNSDYIIDLVKEKLDMEISIIPGDEEARLSYLGASSSMPELNEKIVIDIGGGSTEVIYGKSNDILFKKSFQTGVVSLTEKYLSNFPYTTNDLEAAKIHLEEVFTILKTVIPKKIPIIAVAGTPTTLSCITQGMKTYIEDKVERSILTAENMKNLYNQLSVIPGPIIKSKFGEVVSGREDVLFSGLLILNHLLELTDNTIINVSNRGLRYGNIINYKI